MSVYRPKATPYYHFDFQWRGHRFHGTTKATTRRAAEAVERAEIERAKKQVAQSKAALTSLKLDDIAGQYWKETGQHHVNSDETWRQLERLVAFFGKDTLITEIDGPAIARLVAWRRGHRVVRNKKRKLSDCPLIGPFTVNDTTEQLKKLFNYAKRLKVTFESEPIWKDHLLKEPIERVRELQGDEGERLELATRADHAPYFAFAKVSGLRLKECLLKWPEVNWGEGQITKTGKGGKLVTVPITSEIRAILWPLRGHHAEHVFTYIAHRNGNGRIKGRRYPLTYSGVKIMWRRLRKRAGVTGFRFHDLRHDFATKLLRATGNLKLVQRALNHAQIETTMRYAHVLDSEIAEALERVAESRNKSRSDGRKAG